MTLYLFNPSHDEALAAGSPYYYPSTIARRMEVEWATLPALWAQPGDAVWMPDDTPIPPQASANDWYADVLFVRTQNLKKAFWQQVDCIIPWGWDPLVRHRLRKAGAPEHLLPTDTELDTLKRLSSRQSTAMLLPRMQQALNKKGVKCVGESRIVTQTTEAEHLLNLWNGAVVKSLWSCSGRGVFRMENQPTASDQGRLARLLREQGGVEFEPYFQGILDFALEFEAHHSGKITYEGASVFGTNASGGYQGNRIASQTNIEEQIAQCLGGRHILLHAIEAGITELPQLLQGAYTGPLGIDMMAVKLNHETLLLPCVELNLRRTMGHVAMYMDKLSLNTQNIPSWLNFLCYFCP